METSTELELNALLEELSEIKAEDDFDGAEFDEDLDGLPPPPPPRDSLVFDSPLEEAVRTSQRVSVSSDGRISYQDPPAPPARDSSAFGDRGYEEAAPEPEVDDGRFDDGSDDGRFDDGSDDRFDDRGADAVVSIDQMAPEDLDALSTACRVCNNEIEGDALEALGGLYHFECFGCSGCGNKIGTQEFFDRDNQPYCVHCYKGSFLPKCSRCLKPIEGRYLKALGKDFHEACFNCAVCHTAFEDGKFYEKDGNAYCLQHYNELYGYTCGKCHQTITDGSAISALDKYWHRDCFTCAVCHQAFVDGKFFESDGQPYCQEHYHQRRGTICGKCNQPIDGMCVSALDKKWHQSCFTCSACSNVLSGQVMLSEGQVYCPDCAQTL